MQDKFNQLLTIKLDLMGIKPPKEKEDMIEPNPCWDGWEAIGTKIDENGREVPNCVPIKEEMKVKKEGFPVPSPSKDEDESKFMSRCISAISDEYEQEQAVAICISQWQKK